MCGGDPWLELAMSRPKSLREAEALVERCMTDLGIRYPETLSAIIDLSEEYRTSGNLDSAQHILEEAISDYGPWDGEHDYPIERALLQLGAVLANQGQNLAAKAIQEEVLASWRYDFGRGDQETILAMNLLVETLTELGEFAQALSLGLEALEATQTLTGAESDESAGQLSSIALVHRKMRDRQSAYVVDEEPVEILDQAGLGP